MTYIPPITVPGQPAGLAAGAPTGADGSFGATGTYYYVVTAVNTAGESIASSEVNATIAATTQHVPLSWTAVAGAVIYRVYRGTVAASESAYQLTASTSLNDLGAAGTSGAPPSSPVTSPIGRSTFAAPGSATLLGVKDVSGNLQALPGDGSTGLKVNIGSPTFTEIGHQTSSVTLAASVARTATFTSPAQTNANARGVLLYLNLTATPNNTETLTVQVQTQDSISGNWANVSAFAAEAIASTLNAALPCALMYELYPGSAVSSMPGAGAGHPQNWQSAQRALPGAWRVVVTHSSTGSWTYSILAQLEQ